MARSAAIAQILAGTPPRLGPFRLVAELGEGGFAPVFLASEEYGGVELRTVAVKLFALGDVGANDGTAGTQAAARARIVDEARALCHVDHPNIVRFLQIVEAKGGVLGLAMEHVRGRSLGDLLDAERRLPLSRALEIGAAIASALASVHAVGLVHRDVKPGNVVDAGGVYKLIDFGIVTRARGSSLRSSRRMSVAPASLGSAQARSRDVIVGVGETMPAFEELTEDTHASERTVRASEGNDEDTATVAGTMGYIDPVCLARGEPADASSDLYALGAMLYECLTGRMPSSEGDGDAAARIRMNVAMGLAPPPPVRELSPELPEPVARLVDSLVAPRREHRPQRAEWVACELERLRRSSLGTGRALPDEPFRGLGVFEQQHRDVYFGRTADVASAVDLLRSRGLLALVGLSGSGKSSLARAGVLPAILDGALGAWPPRWCTVIFSPGAFPRASLAHALSGLLDAEVVPDDPDELVASLASLVERSETGVVILVDALEELVTLAARDDRAYLAMFLAAIAARPVPGLRWERRDQERRVLSRASLAAIGGLGGALAQHAEATLASIVAKSGASMATVAADLLIALTTPHGTRAARTRAELAFEVPDPLSDGVLAALQKARLVVVDDATITLAHDALIARWPRLDAWVRSARREREGAREVEEAAARWRARPDRDLLLRGGPLRDARALESATRARLSREARAFVGASAKSERRGAAFVVTAASVVLVGLGLVGGLYVRDTRAVGRSSEAQKQEALRVMKVLAEARDKPGAERVHEVEELVMKKHACEMELAACAADAGAHPGGP